MRKRRTKSKIIYLLIYILIMFCILTATVFVYFDQIFTYSVSHFTGYSISFIKWEKSIFDKNYIRGLQLSSQEHNLIMTADNAEIYIDVQKLIKEKKFSVDLSLEGVSVSYFDGDSKHDFSGDSLYGLFVGADQKFNSVSSLISWDNTTFSVSDLNAYSQNIEIFGKCKFLDKGDIADIYIKLSISPDLALMLDPEVRDRVLFKGDDGWYATVINYKGNTVILRALYSFSKAK